jgi:hypothetical protein
MMLVCGAVMATSTGVVRHLNKGTPVSGSFCDRFLQEFPAAASCGQRAEAVRDALDDAGLTPAAVDGMVTFAMDSNTEIAVARATGIGDLRIVCRRRPRGWQ